MPTEASAIVLPDRLAAVRGKVACNHCWEEVSWQPTDADLRAPLFRGRSCGWKHVRTGLVECAPVCDVCRERPAVRHTGADEWNGNRFEFVPRNFFCEGCFREWTKQRGGVLVHRV